MTQAIPINEDNFNRLAKCLMEKYDCTYEAALKRLSQMKLQLVCGEEIHRSLPLQAALLTAINTGKRAFLGGVSLRMPGAVKSLLRWPQKTWLGDIAVELGATLIEKSLDGCFTLSFGLPSKEDYLSLEVVCNGWQGGVLVDGESVTLPVGSDHLPLGGVAAGALAVGTAFLKVSGVSIAAGDQSVGISLWRPDLSWLDSEASGPAIEILPEKYWLLGLGHLGQAFAWNLALLPYADAGEVSIWLQDDDRISEANRSGGLLSEKDNEGQYKTRACAAWLEQRGFRTQLVERRFDEHTQRRGQEPYVALCGFDAAEGRRALEKAGFDLVAEVALGGSLTLFDNIILHTFPGSRKSPGTIWTDGGEEEGSEVVRRQFAHLTKNGCGVLADTLAKTSISSSFVGAFAGALAIAELLRGLRSGQGLRYDTIVVQLRDLESKKAIIHKQKKYLAEMASNGFVKSKTFLTAHDA